MNILRKNYVFLNHWQPVSKRPYWRIYWNSCPGAVITTQTQTIKPDSDHLVAIPAGLHVEQSLETSFGHLYFHVELPNNYDNYPEVVLIPLSVENKKKCQDIARQIKNCDTLLSSRYEWLIRSMLCWAFSNLETKKLQNSQSVTPPIRKALNLINNKLSAGICNSDLAQAAAMTPKTFSRQFTRQTGMTPQKFLNHKRVLKAAQLLINTHMSLDEISSTCGYCDRSHLNRHFTRQFSQSPAAYRRYRTDG